jgi:hypothetical protein
VLTLKHDAVKHVLDCGNAYQKAYLVRALKWKIDQSLIDALVSLQNADGGWPWQSKPGAPSSIVGTSRTLELLLKISLHEGAPAVTDAIYFLLAHRRSDGGWSENPKLSGIIPSEMAWISTTHSMTYATADAVNALTAAGYSDHVSVRKALGFLLTTQNKEGGWGSHVGADYPYGTDIASMDVVIKALALSGRDKRSLVFRRAVEAILLNTEDWKHPVCAAAALNVFLRVGYDPGHQNVTELVHILLDAQKPDGGWSAFLEGASDPGQTAYCAKQLMKCNVEVVRASGTATP